MTRLLIWTDNGWDDYLWWQQQDKKTLRRINKLIEDAKRHPFDGLGKPEPLKGNLSGYWSRRINDTDRLVYGVTDSAITILMCRYHYYS
ncbi:Txe/YoeB family addiction module toxin [Enterobacter sp. RHBSTW-00175]|jgi:toxin YoeB|uniref:Txe/YoeB family addiction module toxin n=1 Tax=unclassified Enterobacter TaxID=2608935 RepID=UPI0015EAA170|nr:Txe/YoeB family addiction module toxin [Enterobacter sp. RHBSTW-00175]HDR2787168.1 Txe/YoeB family addiction module toxin [Enterobacter asburiae]QMR75995.1 Txe/YoeB family addiction module toxin [Enterobacter sp. RHBSTW-00175]HDR2803408.1 Txe/YoeB family addiction module toxin [Enterobacter asburiae]HDR2808672.1 Txe/YoeB family addiction module toxin [Enterobacter asburiae]HDR2814109.1 Txe/YoeB family addiction module toxin [Enterobacter asburiae]